MAGSRQVRLFAALLAAVLAGGLAACSKGENNLGDRLIPILRGALLDGDEAGVGRRVEPTREVLNQIPAAVIGLEYGDLPPVYLVPLADNGGYLSYQDEGRRGVVMFGGAVAGTLGLGNDLKTVKHGLDDPVAHRTPLAQWPRSIHRTYEYRVRDLDDFTITVACEIEPIAPVMYEIVELQLAVTRVVERCSNAVRSFENIYWVDDTGFVWASRQWLGPDLDAATIEVVRPYSG